MIRSIFSSDLIVFAEAIRYTQPIHLGGSILIESLIKTARDRIASARSITVLTGAGISADSGVPTFRGEGGALEAVSGGRACHAGSV